MAFQFPDPNVTPEFEGDNGIFYIWDPVDEKWTIKGFKADLDDRYVNKLGGDSMEGPLELTGVDGNLKFGTAGSKVISSDDTELAVVNSGGVFYDGNISSERHVVNKGYVDEADDRLQLQISLNTQSIINNSQEIDTITDDVVKQNNDGIKVVRHGETSFYAPEPLDLILTYRKLGFEQSKNLQGDNQLHFVKFAGMIVDRKTGTNYVGQEINSLDQYGNNKEYASIAAPQIVGNEIIFATGQHTDGNSFQVARASTADPDKPYVIEAFNDGKISKHKARIRWSVKLDDKRILYLGHPLDGCRPGEAPSSTANPLEGDGPNQEQIVCLLDTDDLVNGVHYETFDRVDVNGDPHIGLKSLTKLIADDIGGAPAVVNRGRVGAQAIYIVQAGRNIKRVVTGDLDNKEVTLEDETTQPLSFEYILVAGGRRGYKGKVSGLTVYENRYLIWHSFAEGILCYDTILKTLTNLYPTPETIVYGNNELDSISPAVPQLFGSLYFVAETNKDIAGLVVDPKVIVVNSDLSTDTVNIPISAYVKAGSWNCTKSDRTSNNEIFCTNLGYYCYKYNAVDNSWVEYEISDSWGAGGVFRVNGVNTITPVAYYDGPGHSWAYKDAYYMELVNGLNPNILENSDWSFLQENSLEKEYYESIDYTPYDHGNTAYPLTLAIKPAGWTGNGAPGEFWYDDPVKPFHCGFKGGNQAHVNAFPVGTQVKIEHTGGILYATVAGSWYSGQVHLNLSEWVWDGDYLVNGEEVTQISYGEFLPQFVRTAGGTMTGDLIMEGNRIQKVAEAVDDTDAINFAQLKEGLAFLRDQLIADTVQGTWGVDNVQSLTSPGAGRTVLTKGNGQAATKFSEVQIIRFYENNDDGQSVDWSTWGVGENIKFVQTSDETVTGTFRLLTAPSTSGTTRTVTVEYLASENDLAPFGNYMEQYQVTLSQLRIPA